MKTLRSLAFITLAVFALSLALTRTSAAHGAQPSTDNVLTQYTSQGHILGFRADGFLVSNATYALQVKFVGANAATPRSDAPAATKGYAAPPLVRVTYANLWDGITLAYDAPHGGVVRSTYRIEPHANPGAIQLRYNAPVTLNADGTLNIAHATGQMVESAPVAWQEQAGGVRVPVAVTFARRDEHEVAFAVGAYDASQPLFIDPTLTWSTFLGGSGDDQVNAITVDGSGNVYVAGYSTASWGSPLRAFTGSHDAFVAKIDNSPTVPIPVFPPDRATIRKPKSRVEWKCLPCGDYYDLKIKDTTIGKTFLSQTGIKDTQFQVKGLERGHSYSWQVTACNIYGCTKGRKFHFTINKKNLVDTLHALLIGQLQAPLLRRVATVNGDISEFGVDVTANQGTI